MRRHLERLHIIDPVVGSLAAARWLYQRSLSAAEIVELTGRAESTIAADLRATYLRLLLLDVLPPPDPAMTYAPARAAGLSQGAAAFAFWFAYTLSAERAAELSGYGRGGATTARKHVLGKLVTAGLRDPRLRTWSESLTVTLKKLEDIRTQADVKVASTTLGKRRSDLHPKLAKGQMPALIPWLDEIDGACPDVDLNFTDIERRALARYALLDGDPVALLAHALEHDPANVITVALELAGRDLPYFDTFRAS
ncbi:MAG: hypothetical protein ABI488_05670 [Polyangiaceae bacterium]